MENGALVGLQANYSLVEQSGLAVQATIEAWLLKTEAITLIEKSYGRNSAAVFGLEYIWFALGGGNADIGLVVEYQWDDRIDLREQLAKSDLALFVHWAFNDIDGSQLLALVNLDLEKTPAF